jgi:large subunit ribosomal protein L30
MAKIKIIQIKSSIGISPNQRANLRALGLRKRGSEVEQDNSPQIEGMIKKVQHLISIDKL